MEKINQEQNYITDVAKAIMVNVLKLYKTDMNEKDQLLFKKITANTSKNLNSICKIVFGQNGAFDEFTADNIENNWNIGVIQAKCEYLGVNINVTKYFSEDISDLEIQLLYREDDFAISVLERANEETISIKNDNEEIRYQFGKLRYYDGKEMREFLDVKDFSLDNIYNIWNNRDLLTQQNSIDLVQNSPVGMISKK